MAWLLKDNSALEAYVGRKLLDELKWWAAIPSAMYMSSMNVLMANDIIEDEIKKWKWVKLK